VQETLGKCEQVVAGQCWLTAKLAKGRKKIVVYTQRENQDG